MAEAVEEKGSGAVAAFGEVIAERDYKQQAQFFLNAEWPDINTEPGPESDPEAIYQYVKFFYQADDEFPQDSNGRSIKREWALQVLQRTNLTMTALAFNQEFRQIDIDSDNRMSCLEFLVFWLRKRREEQPPSNPNLATSTIGIAEEVMSRPQGTNEKLENAERALGEVQAEVARIEAHKNDLETKAAGSGVRARTAAAELAQLLAADQTELNVLVVRAEAAVRMAKRDDSLQAQGKLWWLDREIEEAKKYKPKKKSEIQRS